MSENTGNLKLIGTTETNGGRFGEVRIVGESRIHGPMECGRFSCTGTADIAGDLKAETLKLTGELTIQGNLTAGKGQLTGEIRVHGGCRGDRLKQNGQLTVQGDCEYESLRVNGAVQVDGLLSAETLELRLYGPSDAKEVGGGRISVKRSRVAAIRNWFATAGPYLMTAELIEGDIVELEHTHAQVVRGNRVRLGPGCEIGRVEYRRSLSKAGGAEVGAEEKID